MANDVEPVTVKGVELAVTTSEESRAATIERVWLDEVRPRAGHTVPLKVLTRSYRGAENISHHPDRDSRQRLRPAHGDGDRRPAVEPDRAARAAPQRPAAERRRR